MHIADLIQAKCFAYLNRYSNASKFKKNIEPGCTEVGEAFQQKQYCNMERQS